MALIKTETPETAQGVVKEAYDMTLEKFGIIPKPLEMMSASPGLLELAMRRVHYFASHPKLSFTLLTHIRYLVSCNLNYSFCADLNKMILKKQGLEEADFQKMEADPSESLLEENESAMLAFVVNAAKAPSSVKAEDIERLRELGWDDRDMVDALAQGVSMIDHAIMMEVFQMDQSCLPADRV